MSATVVHARLETSPTRDEDNNEFRSEDSCFKSIKGRKQFELVVKDNVNNCNSYVAAASKVKRRRRRKSSRRKWKPYNKTSWAERHHRKGPRKDRKCLRMLVNGKPSAPYNTTEFLMEEHKSEYEDGFLGQLHQDQDCATVGDSDTDSYYYAAADEEKFVAEQFSSEYNLMYSERLNSMTKEELIEEYLQLEERVESMNRLLQHTNSENHSDDSDGEMNPGEMRMDRETYEKVRILTQEIEKLSEENSLLKECVPWWYTHNAENSDDSDLSDNSTASYRSDCSSCFSQRHKRTSESTYYSSSDCSCVYAHHGGGQNVSLPLENDREKPEEQQQH